MRTLVVGIGGVGGWVLARLTEGGADVEGWARGETLERLSAGEPLVLQSYKRDWSGPVRVVGAPAGPYDLVIVCTKSAQTAEIADAIEPGPIMLSAQNGLENPAILRRRHPNTLASSVYVAAERTDPTTIVNRATGHFVLDHPEVAEFLNAHGVQVRPSDDMVTALWRKLMGNVAINSIAALTRLGSGEYMAVPGVRDTARRALDEVWQVARAEGAQIDHAMVDVVADTVDRVDPTGRPSTLQDVLAGRPLEHDAITGVVLRRAATHGIAVPTVATFHALLSAIDVGSVTVQRVAHDDPDVRELIAELDAELSGMYPEEGANFFTLTVEDVAPENGALLVARVGGQPAACAAVRRIDAERAEIKRMYTRPEFRGRRLAEHLLDELERLARLLGVSELVLETGERQGAAMSLYARRGFEPCPCWGEYAAAPLSRCYAKRLSVT